MQGTILSQVEAKRLQIIAGLKEHSKGLNGQFMTPAIVADAMAKMFSKSYAGPIRLLDPGAGSGALMSAFLDIYSQYIPFESRISVVAYELDPFLVDELKSISDKVRIKAQKQKRDIDIEVIAGDYILDTVNSLLLELNNQTTIQRFTHVIMNPPYRKLSSDSKYRKALSSVGIEVNNYYAAFVALSIELLEDGGELVAITPRSFCNGPYFRPFREFILKRCSIKKIHLFESRQSAFKEEDVLQENIIFNLVKNGQLDSVQISTSYGRDFKKIEQRNLSHTRIISPEDEEKIIHIPANEFDDYVLERMRLFPLRLADLNLDVSTGPVVDFRARDYINNDWEDKYAPLIYPSHFNRNSISWPRIGKKPNAIEKHDDTRKWLLPNGNYVLIRRFSSKEEPRRIIPALFTALDNTHDLIGFENHLNVIHSGREGLKLQLAMGLTCYFASTLVDIYFRQFSGHTQVNASDLRTLPIPDISILLKLAQLFTNNIEQELVDNFIERILFGNFELTSPDPVEIYFSH